MANGAGIWIALVVIVVLVIVGVVVFVVIRRRDERGGGGLSGQTCVPTQSGTCASGLVCDTTTRTCQPTGGGGGGGGGTTCQSYATCPSSTVECRSLNGQAATCNTRPSGELNSPCAGVYGINSCAVGLTCDTAASQCKAQQGFACPNGNADCVSGQGLTCQNRVCVPQAGAQCSIADSRCADKNTCDTLRNICIPLGLSCTSSRTCTNGLVCIQPSRAIDFYHCLSPAGGFCQFHVDCQNNQCTGGRCQQ